MTDCRVRHFADQGAGNGIIANVPIPWQEITELCHQLRDRHRRAGRFLLAPRRGNPAGPAGSPAPDAWQETNLVFCYEDGRPYTRDALNWRFSKMTQRAGIGHWHAHEGRHTAVSIRA